mgnify:CR=1 FL=1
MTQTEPTDLDLWSAVAAGDEAAFGTLFDRHSRAVYNHAFRLSGSWSVAEDITQATFLAAWRKRGSVQLTHGTALVVAGALLAAAIGLYFVACAVRGERWQVLLIPGDPVGNIGVGINGLNALPHGGEVGLRYDFTRTGIDLEDIRVLVLVCIHITVNELEFIEVK